MFYTKKAGPSAMEVATSLSLYICLLFMVGSCGNSVGPEKEGKSAEATMAITNPKDKALLNGEVPLTIEGQAQNGFAELRLYLDDQQVRTVTNPSLPHEMTLESFRYDNGKYDLTAELDVAGGDSTISKSISVSLENYLLTLDTGGALHSYISNDSFSTYFIITDPQGHILKQLDLSDKQNQTLQVLPPEELDSTPRYFSATQLIRIKNDSDFSFTGLQTYVILNPWQVHLEGRHNAAPSESAGSMDQLVLSVNEIPQTYSSYAGAVTSEKYIDITSTFYYPDSLKYHLNYDTEAEQMVTILFPGGDHRSNLPPIYRWENLAEGLAEIDSLNYDARSDFEDMAYQELHHPTDLELVSYDYTMSAKPDAWGNGELEFPTFDHNYAGSGNDDRFRLYIPRANHLFRTTVNMKSKTGSATYYQRSEGELPEAFKKIDVAGEVFTDGALQEMNLQLSGEADYAQVHFKNSDDVSWTVWVPDTMETYRLSELPEFVDKQNLQLDYSRHTNHSSFDGYMDMVRARWGTNPVPNASMVRGKTVSY